MKNPIIFFKGNLVIRPSDPVCFRGEDLDVIEKIRISDGKNSFEPELIQRDIHSLKFVIPESFEKTVYSCELIYEGGSKLVRLNEPLIRWIQCDEGANATRGGWMRVTGECISVFDGKVSGALNGRALENVKVLDNYAVEFAIPEDIENGKYTFTYSNGFAEAEPVEVEIAPSPRDFWPKTVFSISDFGAGDNADEGIGRALEAAEKNGGGIVYIPAGTWTVHRTFRIPPRTAIKGAGIKKTLVAWDGYTWEIGELPEYMISGTTDFAIEDISFGATRIGNFIANIPADGISKNIYIQRIRVHSNPTAGTRAHRIEGGIERQRDIIAETMCFRTDLFRIDRAENVRIEDSYFLCGGRPMGGGIKKYMIIRNNNFDGMITLDNWFPLGYCEYCIMENNELHGYTIGTSGAYFYFAGNRITEVLDNNREAFTTDMGGGTAYHGTAKKLSDTKYLFPVESNVAGLANGQDGIGHYKAVYILRGRGMGQYRKIKSYDGDAAELYEPFEVEPDETSEMTVNAYNESWYMVNNEMRDTGDFQFFVPQVNTVVDNLRVSGCRGVVGWGGFIYDGWCTQWYISFVNCRLSDGRYYHMESPDRSKLIVMGRYNVGPTTLANVVRDGKFDDFCCMMIESSDNPESITDLMVYNNEIADVDVGITVSGKTLRSYIAGNRFSNVDKEICISGEQTEAFIEE